MLTPSQRVVLMCPSSMIALCRGCHASKTSSRNAATMRNRLRQIAAAEDLKSQAESSAA